MMLLNTLLDELTGRGSGTEAERHERYTWLEQLRFTNPLADEGGPMAGIPYYQWCRLPQALVVAGQHTDLLVGTTSALYLVFEGRHACLNVVSRHDVGEQVVRRSLLKYAER